MPKGQKQCECGQTLGCRVKVCHSCGKQLVGDKNPEVIDACRKAVEAYNKGDDKLAEEILENAGALAKKIVVTEKNVIVGEKPPRKKRLSKPAANKEPINWHTLERGDIIKVSQMDGSTWILQTGEEVPMGDNGNFKVLSRDANGLHCWALGKKSGHHYIYLGPEITTESGLIRKPHKILKVKKFIKEEDE